MKLLVNGEAIDVEVGTTVLDVVRRVAVDERGIAVAVDRDVVPKSQWSTRGLEEGSRVEVLTAAAGG